MSRVTGQKLKPIIIAWCCLYVALINCDENSIAKNKIVEPEEVRKPGHESDKIKDKSLLSDNAELEEPDAERLNVKKNSNIVNEATNHDPSVNKHNETENITSKNIKNHGENSAAAVSDVSTSTVPNKSIDGVLRQPMNVGALQRGFYVFLGLSVIVIAYIIFRCSRLSKNRTQMVRKYGVLAHRQDVEMRPLPLDDEDEDDTTVFDASEVGVHGKRHEST